MPRQCKAKDLWAILILAYWVGGQAFSGRVQLMAAPQMALTAGNRVLRPTDLDSKGLSDQSITLKPKTIKVTSDTDTKSLLMSHGIFPNYDAINVTQDLNPSVDVRTTLPKGTILTVPAAFGPSYQGVKSEGYLATVVDTGVGHGLEGNAHALDQAVLDVSQFDASRFTSQADQKIVIDRLQLARHSMELIVNAQ